MINCCRIYNLLPKQNFHNLTSRLLTNSNVSNFCKNEKIAKLSISTTHNRCNQVLQKSKRSMNFYLGFYPETNYVFGRNFSMSNVFWAWSKSNQDKEKMKNYILFGGILCMVIFVIVMFQIMPYHEDYVFIEPSEKKK